jgi:hypothetical protein
MATKRAKTPADAVDLLSVFAALSDDAFQDFVEATPALGSLASASKQLCNLFRCRPRLTLRLRTPQDAALLLTSLARGRPFLGCQYLDVKAGDSAVWCMVGGLLSAAGQWPVLKILEVDARSADLPPGVSTDHVATGVLGVLPAVQSLREVTLYVLAFGACSAALMGRVTQLTRLDLTVEGSAADGVVADLTALSRLVRLQELNMHTAPPVQPAAGPEGPYCLPSSLVSVSMGDTDNGQDTGFTGAWLTHLRGCPNLQQLQLYYGDKEHASANPTAVLELLAQHHKQLRVLELYDCIDVQWGVQVPGLPDAAALEGGAWQPTAALATLTGLQRLAVDGLCITDQADWQLMAQLTALTKLDWAELWCAPAQQAGITLPRLKSLGKCTADLSGHELGLALLACPALRDAHISILSVSHPAAMQAPGIGLVPHPTLQTIHLDVGAEGAEDAAGAAAGGDTAAAAAYFAAVKPVLSGVSDLCITEWPGSSTLPDLSDLAVLTRLSLYLVSGGASHLQVVDIVSLVSPLVTLQSLHLGQVPLLCAQAVLPLQFTLPQLRYVYVSSIERSVRCRNGTPFARLLEPHEAQVLRKVQQLLRPGLQLCVQ